MIMLSLRVRRNIEIVHQVNNVYLLSVPKIGIKICFRPGWIPNAGKSRIGVGLFINAASVDILS
ncbi:hypothetical protein DYBT9623_02975 [Dyadobacter sp. CECT 9623]|uniref:Uncharacterized protein n=1 Tax=Dyadobacter linearis TaxID=2823330 RepID=A0ABM8URV0_9BACT|nr:hypothetical protein DYBT9623_02975 [Dyadobacter sp. CECT 9623]